MIEENTQTLENRGNSDVVLNDERRLEVTKLDAESLQALNSLMAGKYLDNFATKEDVANLRSEMHKKFGQFAEKLGELRGEFSEKLGELKGEVKTLHQKIEGIENKLGAMVYKIVGGFFVSICIIAAGGLGAFLMYFA